MTGPRQFSLGYLFLEIFWIAAALGCATQAYRLPATSDVLIGFKAALVLVSAVCAGAAYGGLFRNMIAGALVVTVAAAAVVTLLVAMFG